MKYTQFEMNILTTKKIFAKLFEGGQILFIYYLKSYKLFEPYLAKLHRSENQDQ